MSENLVAQLYLYFIRQTNANLIEITSHDAYIKHVYIYAASPKKKQKKNIEMNENLEKSLQHKFLIRSIYKLLYINADNYC